MILIATIYISIYSMFLGRKLAPAIRAIAEEREFRMKVSVMFAFATVIATVAWSYVISAMLEAPMV